MPGDDGTRDDVRRLAVRETHILIPQEGMPVTTATKVAIKPLEDRILVQANEAETTTASGIVIPDTAKENPRRGRCSPSARVASTTRAAGFPST